MGRAFGLGIGGARPRAFAEPKVSHVLIRHPLQRVLSFTGYSIDDVVNNPLVKNKVLGYYKLHKFVERRSEIVDLERQWNSV